MSESLRTYLHRILKTAIPVALILFSLFSCKEKSIPKPYGYFRIDFPDKSYRKLPQGFPYSFEIPGYSIVEPDMDRNAEPYWINIQVPSNRAQIHISYKKVEGNLFLYAEQSRKLAYDHAIKASSIREEIFRDENHRVFATIYHIEGNSASPMQFYLTDSSRHFLRGSLYIKATPRIDSLKPVIDFLKTDVSRLIETLEWTK